MFKVGGPVRRQARSLLRSYVRYRPTEVDRRLDYLGEIVRRADSELFADTSLTRYEFRVFSQNGEDGVVVELLNRVGATNRYFVEFGIQDGSEGNCVLLADVLGWSGLFIEASDDDFAHLSRKYAGSSVDTLQALVTAEGVNELFRKARVPEEFDVLSIDIDGNDLYVWRSLTKYRPRIVVIEYNAGIRAHGPVAQAHAPERAWDGSGAFGSSIAALEVVGRELGYSFVHSDLTGTNAFFVRDDLVDRVAVTRPPRRSQNFGLTGISQRPAEPPGGWTLLGT